jgi:hypothetical protein
LRGARVSVCGPSFQKVKSLRARFCVRGMLGRRHPLGRSVAVGVFFVSLWFFGVSARRPS